MLEPKRERDRERERRKKDESDRVERKCVHSRLILRGPTHWVPARTPLSALTELIIYELLV